MPEKCVQSGANPEPACISSSSPDNAPARANPPRSGVYAPWPTILYSARGYPRAVARPIYQVAPRLCVSSSYWRGAIGLRLGLGGMDRGRRGDGKYRNHPIAPPQGPETAPVAFSGLRTYQSPPRQKTQQRPSRCPYAILRKWFRIDHPHGLLP